ncbi:MAG: head GIN domain-containing protein [Xanthobacteraceae bacterium]
MQDEGAGVMGSVFIRLCCLPILAATLAGCDFASDCSGKECIKGSATLVTQSRAVGRFTAITLDSIGDLTVERTGTDSLAVTTDDNLQPIVTSEVKNGTLVLAEHGCRNCSPTKIAFKVTAAELSNIALPGTGSADVSQLDAPTFTVTMDGTGSLKLTGKVDELKVGLSGTGSCDASGLVAKRASVDASGTGNVRVNVTDELKAKVTGTGSIRYKGSPKLTQSVSGTGSIKAE